MAGYDGPSFFRHKNKENDKISSVSKTNNAFRKKKTNREERSSMNRVPYQKAGSSKKKRSSTPFIPKKLPPKEYFEHRFSEGLHDSKELYEIIRGRLKKSDQDVLLFENAMKKDRSQMILKSTSKTPTGLHRKLEDIFIDNGHIQIKNPEKFI